MGFLGLTQNEGSKWLCSPSYKWQKMRSPALVSRAHMRFGLTQESCPEHNRKFCSSVFKFLPYAHIQTHIYWQRVVIMMSHLLAPQQSCNPKCTIVSVFAANLMELRDTQLKCRGNCLKALFGKIKTTLPSLYFQLWLHCYWHWCGLTVGVVKPIFQEWM